MYNESDGKDPGPKSAYTCWKWCIFLVLELWYVLQIGLSVQLIAGFLVKIGDRSKLFVDGVCCHVKIYMQEKVFVVDITFLGYEGSMWFSVVTGCMNWELHVPIAKTSLWNLKKDGN